MPTVTPRTPRTPYRVRKMLEIAFRRWLTGQAPSGHFVSMLREQSRETYRARLAAQFSGPMSWESYGKTWTVDHVVPLSAFDLSDPAAVRLAWSLDNVRPMTCQGNKARGASACDAYCSLLASSPAEGAEHAALLAMVEPQFRAAFPALVVRRENR